MKYAANLLPIITAVLGTMLGQLVEVQFQINDADWIVSPSTIGMGIGIFVGLIFRDRILRHRNA